MKWKLKGFFCLFLVLALYASQALGNKIPTSERAKWVISSVEARLKKELADTGLEYGAPIFIRIFKRPSVLELWMQKHNGNGDFKLFKTYKICKHSGFLGPKLRTGDGQAPEGFYYVPPRQLNPWSQFHLSFNLGFPNAYDKYHGRSGNYLMVHGNCVSIGCYAMTDTYIREIYTLAAAALSNEQPFFRVHIFPFELEPERLESLKSHRWYSFWKNLKQGYDYFETYKKPPNVMVSDGKYAFGE